MTTTPLSGKPTFGAGRVFAIGAYANPTPIRAPVPQSQSIDFKRKTESLFGEKQLAVAIGAGEMEVSGKVEFGKISARIFADLLFADAGAAGSYAEADGELVTVPAASVYTVAVANAANFLFDLGVVNVTTGVIYTCVAAGSEMSGVSYSVATSGANKGKYTFATGDANANMKVSYAYSVTATGETIGLANQTQGLIGGFQAVHVLPWGNEQDMFVMNNCIANSAGISLKKSGFANNTLDYMASTDAYGNLGTATFAEAA
jgi:hypothetical protein